MAKHTVGFVYVLSNKAMPGMVKVGMTTKLTEARAKQLHSTAVPFRFDVEYRAATSYPKAVETEAHAMLETLRVTSNREFFWASPAEAIDRIQAALLNASGIRAWQSDEQHYIDHGDRIAVSMEESDLFAVLSYPDLVSRHAEVLDIWQAHADSDLLELMGTRDAEHVAGLSDGDPSGDSDPVPYLDRAGDVPNGAINGRERLLPGERLLWVRPMDDGKACQFAMFEMRDYCQAVSRTWDSKLAPDGHPFLLNDLTKDPPSEVVGTVQAALQMRRPRTWAPRKRLPEDGWVPISGAPQPPDYWLMQLGRRGHGGRR